MEADPRPGRARRRGLVRLLVAGAALGALAWTVASLGPRRVLDVALEADARWLALSVLPVIARFLVWGVKWSRLLARHRPVPFSPALRILLAGSFVNLTTPTAKLAGGVLRALLLHRHYRWGKAVAYGWALTDQVTNVLGNLVLFGVLATVVGMSAPLQGRLGFLGAGLGVLLAVGTGIALRPVAWSLLGRRAVDRRLARLVPSRFAGSSGEAAVRTVRVVLEPLLRSAGSGAAMWSHVGLSAVAFSALCLANAMVLRALGADVSLLLLSVAVVVGYFAGALVGVGGIGVTEVALTGLYVRFGVPADQAAAAALLHRALFYGVSLSWGAAALWKEGRPTDAPSVDQGHGADA